MKTTLILSAFVGLCTFIPQSLHAQSVLIDFDATSAVADNLTKSAVNTGGTSGSYGDLTRSASGGLGGGGGASTPVKFSDNYAYTTQTAFAGGLASYKASAYFFISSSWETGTSLVMNLGLTNAAPVVSYGTVSIPTSGEASVVTSLRFSGSGASPAANFVSYNNGASATSSSTSSTLSLSSWYYWETTFTVASATSMTVTTGLYASDASGTVSGTALVTHSATISNSTLLESENLYGFISSQNGNRRGLTAFDNLSFSAVPEPSSYAALFGLVALTGAFTARRRRS
jgi:hypothetical protein